MTHIEVKEWVDANIERKMREFGCPHWSVDVNYESGGPDCEFKQRIITYHERERAYIYISHDCYEKDKDATELEKDIEHELLHVCHAPFEAFWRLVQKTIEEERYDMLREAYSHAAEATVRNLERTRYGLRDAERSRVTQEIEAKSKADNGESEP